MTPNIATEKSRTHAQEKNVAGRSSFRDSISEKTRNNDAVRFVALGGLGEIGRNMMFFEYEDEIIIIDAGLQFPEEETPGIDYIIPNTEYLEKKKRNIKALFITHGHYDHIGAIPYVLDKIGNPPIYATEISKHIILKRLEEFKHAPKPFFTVIKGEETHQISQNFAVQFFDVVHNIPEGVGMIIKTPVGKIVHPGEFKFDYDSEGKPRGLDAWKKLGRQNIHTLMLDSTGVEKTGWSLSERVVEKELESLFKKAKGRIIIGTFASLLDRFVEIIKIAGKLNKKIAISGYSMKTNIQIAQNLKFIKVPKDLLIPLENINKYPENKIMILATGAQGEPNATLMRISNGEHRQIRLRENDMVIFSSSIVPGHEKSVEYLKDNLARRGAIIFDHKMLDIHSSGHAPQEELKAVMKMVKPRFFLPIHGQYFRRWRNAQFAQETLGLGPEKTIIADNGIVVEMLPNSIKITGEKVPSHYVTVDGIGVGDVGEIVLRDRRALAAEGMVVLITTIDKKTGKVLKNPDIISRGFIYLKENQELLSEVRRKIRIIVNQIVAGGLPIDTDYTKNVIRDQISQFFFSKTRRHPMILPVVIEL